MADDEDEFIELLNHVDKLNTDNLPPESSEFIAVLLDIFKLVPSKQQSKHFAEIFWPLKNMLTAFSDSPRKEASEKDNKESKQEPHPGTSETGNSESENSKDPSLNSNADSTEDKTSSSPEPHNQAEPKEDDTSSKKPESDEDSSSKSRPSFDFL